MWAGPAGCQLKGGHPADLARLLAGNVLVANGGVGDPEASSFLGGAAAQAGRTAEPRALHPGQPGWLEIVLSWPTRMIGPTLGPDVRRAATG